MGRAVTANNTNVFVVCAAQATPMAVSNTAANCWHTRCCNHNRGPGVHAGRYLWQGMAGYKVPNLPHKLTPTRAWPHAPCWLVSCMQYAPLTFMCTLYRLLGTKQSPWITTLCANSMDYGSFHTHNVAYILSHTAICDSDDHRGAIRFMPYLWDMRVGVGSTSAVL